LRAGYLIPAALGVAAFLGLTLVRSWTAPDDGALRRTLERPIGGVSEHEVPLQVLVHDLVERVGPPAAVNICRTVANRAVTLSGDTVPTLGQALEVLANQVGASAVIATGRGNRPGLPTIPCPAGRSGDYMTIGFVRQASEAVGGLSQRAPGSRRRRNSDGQDR
jgi:hypothetical protein